MKGIRRSLSSLSTPCGARTNSLVPIQAVKRGRSFRFSLLKEVVKTVTLLVTDSIGPLQMGNQTEGEMIHAVLSAPVLAPYLQGASRFVGMLARRWCLEKLFDWYSHDKMREIPADTRKDMRINELKYINANLILKEMRVEAHSPPARETVAPFLNMVKELERLVEPARLPFVKNFFPEGNTHGEGVAVISLDKGPNGSEQH